MCGSESSQGSCASSTVQAAPHAGQGNDDLVEPGRTSSHPSDAVGEAGFQASAAVQVTCSAGLPSNASTKNSFPCNVGSLSSYPDGIPISEKISFPLSGQGSLPNGCHGSFQTSGPANYPINSQGSLPTGGGQGNFPTYVQGSFASSFANSAQGSVTNVGQGSFSTSAQGSFPTSGQGSFPTNGQGSFPNFCQSSFPPGGKGSFSTSGHGSFPNNMGQGNWHDHHSEV